MVTYGGIHVNKKKTIKRLTASGALLVTLSPMAQTLVGVGGVAHALKPSSEYPQTQFEADLAAYQTAKAQYDRDKAAYDTAKAKYDQDLAAYNAENTNYQQALAKYQQDKAVYDQKKAEYDRAMAIAEQNKGVNGWLSEPIGQQFTFHNEPNATMTIKSPVKYYTTPGGRFDYLSKALTGTVPTLSSYEQMTSSQADAAISVGRENTTGVPVVLKVGQTVDVEYTNLENTSFQGRKITKVVYRYQILESPDDEGLMNVIFYNDPTVTLDINAHNEIKNKDVRVRLTPTYYYEDGSVVDFAANGGTALVTMGSTNYDYIPRHVESVQNTDGMRFIYITGSSITDNGGVYSATSNNSWIGRPNTNGDAKWEAAEWDQFDSPHNYYGSGAFLVNKSNFSFDFVSHTYDVAQDNNEWKGYWQQLTTDFKGVSAPRVPTPPTPPVEPKAPTPPTPPTAPAIPVGPSSITKSVSLDDKSYVSAATPGDALDVKKQDATWTWKLDVKLSNNTSYDSLVISDTIENVQPVKASDIRVYDNAGNDVTAKGAITTEAAGGSATAFKWTAKAEFLNELNAAFGTQAKPLEQPRMTVKIKATAKGTDAAKLMQYYDAATNQVIVPNAASITVGGTCGTTGERKTVTEQSNRSHVRFAVENSVSQPEKKVSDLNETSVDRNNLGLVDRNQKYTISFNTGDGTVFSKLVIKDQMPQGFTSNGTAVIKNAAGKDITNLFDVSIQGQSFTATLKDSAKGSRDLVKTKISIELAGTAVRWLGDVIKNKATIEDFSKTLETNETVTIIPDDGEAVKESAIEDVDGEYSRAETDADATQVNNQNDTYFWRNTFTLPNKTTYTKIVISDVFENVQSVDTAAMEVLDADGNNVASKGTFKVADTSDTQKTITWTASDAYLGELNAKYGPNSDVHPTLTLKIPTTVKGVSIEKLERYKTPNKDIIIPNTASIALRDNSGITIDYKIDTNVSKVNVPSRVDPGEDPNSAPKKTVTDANEVDVAENGLGFETMSQTYKITATTAAGYKLDKLNFTDDMPDEFQTSVEQVRLTTAENKDVTGSFDIVIEGGNVVKATLKSGQERNKDLIDTAVTLAVQGVYPKGLGKTVENKAIVEDPYGSYETGTTKTHIPSTPETTKSVSVDGGNSFAEAGELAVRSDEYIWKVDHKLANHTEYEAIVLTDTLEGIQAVDPAKVKVFGYDGTDITSQGKTAVADKGGKKVVTWTAGADYIKALNAKFGRASDDTPSMTMTIATNIKDAKNVDEAKYYNAETGKVEIPNEAGQKLTAKNEGSIEVKSNQPKVTLPTPEEGKATKYVALDGDKPQWSDKLQLDNFDAVYQYRTEFKLARNFNFDTGSLILSDTYENLQSYDKVVMTDASGADITAKFDITAEVVESNRNQTLITATPKNANDFDDAGETVNMVIKGVKLTGATGAQQLQYLPGKDNTSGFGSGVTIPNISKIQLLSSIPNQTQIRESNKTYVNFDLAAEISKKAESEMTEPMDPAKATEFTSLTDLVIAAQQLLTEPGKANEKALKALSSALTDSSVDKSTLLNLLIEASK